MKIRFNINHNSFTFARVAVFNPTDSVWMSSVAIPRFESRVTDPHATVELNPPAGLWRVRIQVGLHIFDLLPPPIRDKGIDQIPEFGGVDVINVGDEIHLKSDTVPLERWMEMLNPLIGDRPLGRILIPDAHDAGSFKQMIYWDDGNSIKDFVAAMTAGLVTTGGAQTQDLDLGDQLKAGIRSLDLRIAKIKNGDNFANSSPFNTNMYYFHHNGHTGPELSVEPQLIKIRDYASTHPNEIILLHLSHVEWLFPKGQFSLDDHKSLKEFIVNLLGSNLIYDYQTYGKNKGPASSHRRVAQLTPNEIIKQGKRILLLGSEGSSNDDADNTVYWPGKTNGVNTYEYVQWISRPWMPLIGRLDEPEIFDPFDPLKDIRNPYTDAYSPSGTQRVPGFKPTFDKLLRRRRDVLKKLQNNESPGNDEPFGTRLFGVGYSFSTADIFSAKDEVLPRAIKWTQEWERHPETSGAQNLISMDYFNHSSLVHWIIRLNQHRRDDYTVTTATSLPGPGFALLKNDQGQNRYIDLPPIENEKADIFKDGFTIQAWVYLSSLNPWARIIDIGTGGTGNYVYLATWANGNTPANGLRLSIYAGATEAAALTVSNVLNTQKWMHVAATIHKDGAMKIFVDGVLKSEKPGSSNFAFPSAVRASNFLGKSNNASDPCLNGRLAEVSLWQVAVPAPTMVPLSGNEAGLVGYWKLYNSANDTCTSPNKIGNATLVDVSYHSQVVGRLPWQPEAPAMTFNGPVKVGSNFATSSPGEAVRIVCGYVDGYGVIRSGKGFTVAKDGDCFKVTFSQPFAELPCVMGSQNSGGSTLDSLVVAEISHGYCRIKTGIPTGAAEHRPFSFVAIGP